VKEPVGESNKSSVEEGEWEKKEKRQSKILKQSLKALQEKANFTIQKKQQPEEQQQQPPKEYSVSSSEGNVAKKEPEEMKEPTAQISHSSSNKSDDKDQRYDFIKFDDDHSDENKPMDLN